MHGGHVTITLISQRAGLHFLSLHFLPCSDAESLLMNTERLTWLKVSFRISVLPGAGGTIQLPGAYESSVHPVPYYLVAT